MATITCPHCDKEVLVSVFNRVEIQEEGFGQPSEARWVNTLSASQKSLLEAAEKTGTMAAFSFVVDRLPAESRPKNRQKFFLGFMARCRQRRVPPTIIDVFNRAWGRVPLEFWASNGVIAVVAAGVIRQFLLSDDAVGTSVRSLTTGAIKARLKNSDDGKVEQWVKSRWGYVPDGANNYLEALKKRSIGEFDRPSLAGAAGISSGSRSRA